jgi:hypothetical protein
MRFTGLWSGRGLSYDSRSTASRQSFSSWTRRAVLRTLMFSSTVSLGFVTSAASRELCFKLAVTGSAVEMGSSAARGECWLLAPKLLKRKDHKEKQVSLRVARMKANNLDRWTRMNWMGSRAGQPKQRSRPVCCKGRESWGRCARRAASEMAHPPLSGGC